MQIVRSRRFSIVRLLTVSLLAAMLLLGIALLVGSGVVTLPTTDSADSSGLMKSDSAPPLTNWHRATDRSTGQSMTLVASVPVGDDSPAKTSHRYWMYQANGYRLVDIPAGYAGQNTAPVDRSNHRYYDIGTDNNGGIHPENPRIGLSAD